MHFLQILYYVKFVQRLQIGGYAAGLDCGSLMVSYFIYPVWGDVIDNNFGFTESAT